MTSYFKKKKFWFPLSTFWSLKIFFSPLQQDSDEENDVSLAEVYNDELEDDNSDWDVGEEEGEDEEDYISENSDAETSGAAAAATGDADKPNDSTESGGQGKKRKHDDEDWISPA